MKKQLTKKSATAFVFATNLLLFVALTAPFKIWAAASEITQMRPAAAMTPVLGMIFGWPAALGCAAGNLICDMAAGYELLYAGLNGLLQILYAMSAYYFWKKINRERGGGEFRLDSVIRILKFCLLLVLNAILTVLFTGILNHAYNVTELLSYDNLFLFINSFDSGLLFGAPLLIAGHVLQMQVENMKEGSRHKALRFSMNERMILNTIITGLCICVIVGAAVYLTDKYGAGGGVGLWGRIYLFETMAMNAYFALSIGFMRFTEKRISKPIEELAQIAGQYYGGEATDEQRKQMVEACKTYAKDSTEVGELARSYINMARDLDRYVDNLKNIMAEKERINAELTLASNIQAHMLPCIFPPFPEHKEFDLYASMNPAKEVGGDFYDFFVVDEKHLAVIVADVSGKGVPAALFMVIAKTLIKNHTQMGMEPAEVFTAVNRLLCDGNDAGLFVTAWMGVLELESGKLTYVNAGHNPPLIKRAEGEFEYLRERSGFVLAGLDEMKYRQSTLKIFPGDRLFLYTDGVTEATDSAQKLYGEERLRDFLNAHQDCGTEEMLCKLQEELEKFAGDAPQFDDITMLLLDYKGALGYEAMDKNRKTERTFAAAKENITEMIGFVEGELESFGVAIKQQTAICVAMEEIFVNIANYAYPEEEGDAKVEIEFDENTGIATFVVTDRGVAFDPLAKEDPDITLSAEERSVGGLGIFIVKKTMDRVAYARENGQNILTMTKKLERSKG